MLRDERLEREAFDTLLEAKVLIERWRQHYNTIRPHSALGYRPPAPKAMQPCAVGGQNPNLKTGDFHGGRSYRWSLGHIASHLLPRGSSSPLFSKPINAS